MEQDDRAQETRQNLRKRTASEVGPPGTTAPKVIKLLPQSDVHSIFCTICLKTITTETLGKPDACDHQFCLACILQWSKTKNSCPVDRERFRKIYFTNPSHGRFEGHVTVANIPELEDEEEDEEVNDPIFDQLCRVCTNDLYDLAVRCSGGCRKGVHQACVGSTLHGASERWRCDNCTFFHRGFDVMEEAGLTHFEDEPEKEVDLSPDEIECYHLYWDAIIQFMDGSERRLELQLDIDVAVWKIRASESREKLLACQERYSEQCGRSKDIIEIMGRTLDLIEKRTDQRLADLEGDDDALDEYIATAQKALEDVDKSEERLRAAWEDLEVEKRLKDLKSSLEELLEEDDE